MEKINTSRERSRKNYTWNKWFHTSKKVQCVIAFFVFGVGQTYAQGPSSYPPTINSVKFTPSTVSAGNSSTLSWSSNASYCKVDGQYLGSSSSKVYSNLTSPKTVKVECYTTVGGYSYKTASVDVGPAAPPAPSSITAPISDNDGTVSVSWYASSGANSYVLQRSSDSGSNWAHVYTGTDRNRTVPGLTNGTHVFRVRACVGSSPCSDWTRSGNLVVSIPPSPPTTVQNVPVNPGAGIYRFTWSTVGSAYNYAIQRDQNDGNWGYTTFTSNTQKDFTLPDGVHRFKVASCTQQGSCGTYKAGGSFTVLRIPSVPSSVSVSETVSTDGRVNVNWGTASGSVARYEVRRGRSVNTGTVFYSGGARQTESSSMTEGMWYFSVRACNSAGCSGWKLGASTNVSIPPGLAISKTTSTDASYSVSWDLNTILGTPILYERKDGGSWNGVVLPGRNTDSKNYSKLENGVYSYKVSERDCRPVMVGGSCIVTKTSEIKSVNVDVVVPPTPSNFAVNGGSGLRDISLSWSTPLPGIPVTYTIDKSLNQTNWQNVYTGTTASAVDAGVDPAHWYYRLRACRGNQCSGYALLDDFLGREKQYVTVSPATSANGSYSVVYNSLEDIRGRGSYTLLESINGRPFRSIVSLPTTRQQGTHPISGRFAATYQYKISTYDCSGLTAPGCVYHNSTIGTVNVYPGVPNTPPTLSNITNKTTQRGWTLTPLASFTFSDQESPLDDFEFSVSSSNPSVLHPSNIEIAGNGNQTQLTVDSALSTVGSTIITVSVSDPYHTVEESFTLTVNPIPTPDVGHNAKYRVFYGESKEYSEDTDALYFIATDGNEPSFEVARGFTTDITEKRIEIYEELIIDREDELALNHGYYVGDLGDNETEDVYYRTNSSALKVGVVLWDSSGVPSLSTSELVWGSNYDVLSIYDVVISDKNKDGYNDIRFYDQGEFVYAFLSGKNGLISTVESVETPRSKCAAARARAVNVCDVKSDPLDEIACHDQNALDVTEYCFVNSMAKIVLDDSKEVLGDLLTEKSGEQDDYKLGLIERNLDIVQMNNVNDQTEVELDEVLSEYETLGLAIQTQLSNSLSGYEISLQNLATEAGSATTSAQASSAMSSLDTMYSAEKSIILALKKDAGDVRASYELAKTNHGDDVSDNEDLVSELDTRTENGVSEITIEKLENYIQQRLNLVTEKTNDVKVQLEEKQKMLSRIETNGEPTSAEQQNSFDDKSAHFLNQVEAIISAYRVATPSMYENFAFQSDRFEQIRKLQQLYDFCSSSSVDSWQGNGCNRITNFMDNEHVSRVSSIQSEITSGLSSIANLEGGSPNPDLQSLINDKLNTNELEKAAIYYDMLLRTAAHIVNGAQ